jgi:hypothetical protein
LNGFFIASSVAALLLSLLACLCVAVIAARLRASLEVLPSSLASRVSSLETSRDEQAETLTTLANRVKMQRVRQAVNHVRSAEDSGNPDPYTNPDAWRRETNKQIAMKHLRSNS